MADPAFLVVLLSKHRTGNPRIINFRDESSCSSEVPQPHDVLHLLKNEVVLLELTPESKTYTGDRRPLLK